MNRSPLFMSHDIHNVAARRAYFFFGTLWLGAGCRMGSYRGGLKRAECPKQGPPLFAREGIVRNLCIYNMEKSAVSNTLPGAVQVTAPEQKSSSCPEQHTRQLLRMFPTEQSRFSSKVSLPIAFVRIVGMFVLRPEIPVREVSRPHQLAQEGAPRVVALAV